jgi:hypothetical protein
LPLDELLVGSLPTAPVTEAAFTGGVVAVEVTVQDVPHQPTIGEIV